MSYAADKSTKAAPVIMSLVTVFNVLGQVQQLAGARLPVLKPACSLVKRCSTTGLFCLESFVRKVCTYGIRGRFVCSSSESQSPWLEYGDNLGLSPYLRDLVSCEAYVEHCM